ncbi:hypothetical protein [Nostocoides sp. F2B08]|uniref:hypothetical protein n=1 Tax=Nostocoides sp. F2B08 TaxID=2653936 RepID=UPI001D05B094|nr:hypothetical protein [Tetrasphaera sp. F2B08]
MTESAWTQALESLDRRQQAVLLLYRTMHADLGDPAAATWLCDALAAAGDDLALESALRDEVRRHADASDGRQGFARAWAEHTGEALPVWASLDRELLEQARAWMATPTYAEEHHWLVEHRELLEASADDTIEEALRRVPPEEQNRYRQLRDQARTVGLAEAYRPLLVGELASTFIRADPFAQQELLQERRQDLTDPAVRETLTAAAEGSDDPRVGLARALVDLASDPEREALLNHAFAALQGGPSLAPTLRDPALVTNPPILAALATVAGHAAGSDADLGEALFHLAIVSALTDEPDQAAEYLAAARQRATARVNDWLTHLATIGATYPRVLALIPPLTAPASAGDDPAGGDADDIPTTEEST